MSIIDIPTASAVPANPDDHLVAESPQRLKLSIQSCDGYLIVNVWGELCGGTTDLLTGLLETITRSGCRRVLLDISRLYDLDSDALAELSRWHTLLASSGGCLWLAAPRPWVRRLIEQACLRGTFTIYPTVLEALAELAPLNPTGS